MDTYGGPIRRTRLTRNIGLLLMEQKKSEPFPTGGNGENERTPLYGNGTYIDNSFAVVFNNSLHALIKRGLVKGNYPHDTRYKWYYQRIQTVELTDEGKKVVKEISVNKTGGVD